MEKALTNIQDEEIQEQSKSAIDNTKRTIEREKSTLDNQITIVQENIDTIRDELLYVEIDEGMESVEQLRQQENELISRRRELWEQETIYQDALSGIAQYENLLEIAGNNTASQVGEALRSIQNELFKENPDVSIALEKATGLFEALLKSENLEDNEGTDYITLLNDVNMFIKDLNEYQLVKGINNNFEECIIKLRDEQIQEEDWKEQWNSRLTNLKSLLSALPNYNGEEKVELIRYDRIKSSDHLDNMIRNYIAEHNAAQQGIIYLVSAF